MLDKLKKMGFTLTIENGTLMVETNRPLTCYQREYLKRNKQEILKYLDQKPRVCCLWFYKIDSQCGYTQMGLMTDNLADAQQQLEIIYDKPITDLHKKQTKNHKGKNQRTA